MSKNKPKSMSTKEKLTSLEKAIISMNNILGLYVEYNKDGKGFNRFLEERLTQNKKAQEEQPKEEIKE